MNEIEKKYFEAFKSYVTEGLSVPVVSNENLRFNLTISEIEYPSDTAVSVKSKLYSYGLDSETDFEIELCDTAMTFDGYKPDFLIIAGSAVITKFAIEIDGHEWHEKTKEQAANDRRKDRTYLKNNAIPIRFTGSEVYHDPMNCVKETLEIIVFQSAFYSFF